MTATVIIIGYNAANRLSTALTIPEAALITRRGPCSPSCDQTKAVVVVPPTGTGGNYTLAYTGDKQAKPAETYVLEFASEADAQTWLEAVPATELLGKLVLLVGDAATP